MDCELAICASTNWVMLAAGRRLLLGLTSITSSAVVSDITIFVVGRVSLARTKKSMFGDMPCCASARPITNICACAVYSLPETTCVYSRIASNVLGAELLRLQYGTFGIGRAAIFGCGYLVGQHDLRGEHDIPRILVVRVHTDAHHDDQLIEFAGARAA